MHVEMATASILQWVPDSLYNLSASVIVHNYHKYRAEVKALPDSVYFDVLFKVRHGENQGVLPFRRIPNRRIPKKVHGIAVVLWKKSIKYAQLPFYPELFQLSKRLPRFLVCPVSSYLLIA